MKTPSIFLCVILVLCAICVSAFAGSRSSADYTIPADTIDAGGLNAYSANYSLGGSAVGEFGAASPGLITSANYIDKPGYVGQLSDLLPPAMTFTVTSTDDTNGSTCGPTCTLRQAINASNANPPPPNTTNLIQFNIPGSGVHTITLASGLPVVTDRVIIDGYTQPGASANTLAVGDNAVLLIRIDAAGVANPVLTLCTAQVCGGGEASDGSAVQGLAIVNNGSFVRAFSIVANNVTVAGNFIGVDTDGVTFAGSFNDPVDVSAGTSGAIIGGTSPAARNVMATNLSVAILIDGDSVTVQGNYIDTNAAGTAGLGSANRGIQVEEGSNSIIGGSSPGAGNVIGTWRETGIEVGDINFPNPATVQGNLVGTNATGTATINTAGGSYGIRVAGSGPNIVIADNLISGTGDGIFIDCCSPVATQISGNKIGTDITGTMPIPNGCSGIAVTSGTGAIGGTNAGEGNIIAFNGAQGVVVENVFGPTTFTILGNSIFSNAGLGISLGGGPCNLPVPTINDACDGDTGPNNLQNYPVITSASFGGGFVTISGTLDSTPSTMFRLEFFSNGSCDPSGHGQGQTFLGSTMVMTDENCNASFGPLMFAVPNGQGFVTATATDPSNNTSEFSACAGAPIPISAASRKVHGGVGTFDVPLPLTGNVGVECRTGPTFQMIVNFPNNVTVESAAVTSGTGMVDSFSGNGTPTITVNLSGVTNVQRITVTLHNVNNGTGPDSPSTGDVPVSMGVLAGDTNGNATVNAADVSQTKAQLGQGVTAANFRNDPNANGVINSADVAIVKSHLGEGLP
ncbi:MAG: beta strand repeat-containing protein [Chthoniobacterales bacterium]